MSPTARLSLPVAVLAALVGSVGAAAGGSRPVTAFRIVGLGTPIPVQLDKPPCPQGEWSTALDAAAALRRIGTDYGCGLTISKGTTGRLDPAWIHQVAREHFVLPGGAITAICDEWFRFARDLRHSRATFRCRIEGGGTISGGGVATGGRANYLLRIRRR